MLPALHPGLAFIVSSFITRKPYATIEGPAQTPNLFTGEVGERIAVHDFARASRLSGTYQDGQCAVHDEKSGTQLTLTFQGNTFHGRDLRSGAAFRGSVDRDRVFLFDEECRQRFMFTAQLDRTPGRPRAMRPPLSGHADPA